MGYQLWGTTYPRLRYKGESGEVTTRQASSEELAELNAVITERRKSSGLITTLEENWGRHSKPADDDDEIVDDDE